MSAMTIGYKYELREEQNLRQSYFPKDRIAFYQSEGVVGSDNKAFKQYFHGDISFDQLRRIIAKNNYLETCWEDGMIPEDMMRNELRLLGWERVEHVTDNQYK